MADAEVRLPSETAGEMVRADIALKEKLNMFFSDKDIASTIYYNRHELFIMFIDWSTRIEQTFTEEINSNGE